MNNDVIALISGLMGVIFHTALKGKGLLEDARAGNFHFEFWKDYVIRDFISIFIAVATIPTLWLLQDELIGLYPKAEGKIRIMYFLVGLSGSYLIQQVAGKAKKLVRWGVNLKTNELEGEGTKTDLPTTTKLDQP
jgi:hypothetical protein